jgi:putative protein-disulfide isomerase
MNFKELIITALIMVNASNALYAQPKPGKLIYVYDPLCGWCYGFSTTMKKLSAEYQDTFEFEVISGGMMTGDRVGPLSQMSSYIKKSYKRLEDMTGIKFGKPYLKMLDEGTYISNSLPPSIALMIVKTMNPEKSLAFAHDLQAALYLDGKDLNKSEVLSDLAEKYGYNKVEFEAMLKNPSYEALAKQDFNKVSNWGISGFPTLLYQNSDSLYMLCNGYQDFEPLKKTIDEKILKAK